MGNGHGGKRCTGGGHTEILPVGGIADDHADGTGRFGMADFLGEGDLPAHNAGDGVMHVDASKILRRSDAGDGDDGQALSAERGGEAGGGARRVLGGDGVPDPVAAGEGDEGRGFHAVQ